MNAELITDQCRGTGKSDDAQLYVGEHGVVDFTLGLFRHQVVGTAHEADQQPHNQQVGVANPQDIEGHELGHEVWHHENDCRQDAENYL